MYVCPTNTQQEDEIVASVNRELEQLVSSLQREEVIGSNLSIYLSIIIIINNNNNLLVYCSDIMSA